MARKNKFVVWDAERAQLVTKRPTDRKSAIAYADAMETRNNSVMLVLPA